MTDEHLESSDFVMPQPEDITKREREDAMGAYLMMFGAWAVGLPLPFINLLAALIYHLINHKKSQFVGFNSFQSLMSQLPITVLNAGVLVWFFTLFFTWGESINLSESWTYFLTYLIFTAVLNIVYLIFSIIAAVKSYKGQFFYMFLFGQWAFSVYYLRDKKVIAKPVNRPPGSF